MSFRLLLVSLGHLLVNPCFTREFGAYTREFPPFTREFGAFTREFPHFTREFGAYTRESVLYS
ncbi:hypothetical protein ACJEBK_00555 [Peribacillus frigoritolerans]|uniref:hypothetical protein n=1 Tax=Peribacillus frigoritolerans TaxID=450367 RepID=UPI003871E250